MAERERERFYILDGHSLAYRAFFALPLELTTKEGRHTNAVLGFTSMLLRLLKDEAPDYLAVAFDYPASTFRHQLYGEYKATRQKTPAEMSEQLPLIKEVLTAFNIPFFELEGFEADDIIGTFVRMAREAGMNPVIVTADADAYQLLDQGVEILITRRGISQVERYNGEKLQADYGITARQWIDFKALKGDSSDNIPGVPGVGEKRALQLLREYGSLEEVIRHSGEIKGKVGESIASCAEQALLGRELVTINRYVPLSFSPRECRYRGSDREALMAVLQRLELNRIIANLEDSLPAKTAPKRVIKTETLTQPSLFSEESGGVNWVIGAAQHITAGLAACHAKEAEDELPPPAYVRDRTTLEAAKVKLEQEDTFTLLFHTALPDTRPAPKGLMLFSAGSGIFYIPLLDCSISAQEIWSTLKPLVQNPVKRLITHDYKILYKNLAHAGVEPACTVFDTMLAAYLLEPDRPSYDLLSLCNEVCGRSLALPKRGVDEEEAEKRELAVLSCCCSELPFLMEKFLFLLRERGLERLFYELELPLVGVLARMEMRGITVKEEVLSRLAKELQMQLVSLEQEIMGLAGEKFNLNSPRQLSAVLFEKLGLPVVRRIKTGYSTDARALQELAAHHPIAEKLVQYRTVSKLIGTYLDGLRPLIDPATGRIYTTFNQAVTATGRLSSRDPNLQNIPTRFAEGRRLREAFTASREENLLLAADYSQIELRILAHLSGDEGLVDAFKQDQDVHTRTAADVFNVEMEAVTPRMRNAAKAVNFGIIYGISDYGLSQDLRISRGEAKKFISNYFQRYSGVKSYINRCIALAREQGYVTTLMARRRYIPDINHPNHNRRSFAERVARNTPIQGSAADIIKAAMVSIDRELKGHGFAAVMLLQVHDELIFELPPHELATVAQCVKRLMEEVIPLSVPLKVDLKAGRDWYHLCPLEGD
ncbi:MAG: DNA polymerase I [Bacillota bacterium]